MPDRNIPIAPEEMELQADDRNATLPPVLEEKKTKVAGTKLRRACNACKSEKVFVIVRGSVFHVLMNPAVSIVLRKIETGSSIRLDRLVKVGDKLEYTRTVHKLGMQVSKTVTVTVVTPSETSIQVEHSPNGQTWTIKTPRQLEREILSQQTISLTKAMLSNSRVYFTLHRPSGEISGGGGYSCLDTSFKNISAPQITLDLAHTSMKRHASALETIPGLSLKRPRHEDMGKTSTSASIIEEATGFSNSEKAKLILKLGQEDMFGRLLVTITDVGIRKELMHLKLGRS
ncbi:hypothetical protein K435DRAFT_798361 [Dendrothele bispora CBS 962.96]|uniref:Uncharacterized protein n=1 Tax=Dendrothele bispora (strain CBS 962.96) TaxID=1314807 RepID=A0A4S8M0L8_DENBC|nr:hypothetical protein K435DRAFT_798361 [Dendrothele bispora CBS 962.96]